jgi:hypothetical protein
LTSEKEIESQSKIKINSKSQFKTNETFFLKVQIKENNMRNLEIIKHYF